MLMIFFSLILIWSNFWYSYTPIIEFYINVLCNYIIFENGLINNTSLRIILERELINCKHVLSQFNDFTYIKLLFNMTETQSTFLISKFSLTCNKLCHAIQIKFFSLHGGSWFNLSIHFFNRIEFHTFKVFFMSRN